MNPFAHLSRALSTTVLATFGEPVVFYLEGRDPVEGQGVFTAAYQLVEARPGGHVQGAVGVSAVQPVLEVVAAHLPKQPTEGDEVAVRGLRYLIVDVQPDGHGFLKLFLHKTGSAESDEEEDGDDGDQDDAEPDPSPEDEDS